MIATFVRRRTPTQRIALFLIFVILADFGADDGCDCGPNDLTHATSLERINHHAQTDDLSRRAVDAAAR